MEERERKTKLPEAFAGVLLRNRFDHIVLGDSDLLERSFRGIESRPQTRLRRGALMGRISTRGGHRHDHNVDDETATAVGGAGAGLGGDDDAGAGGG